MTLDRQVLVREGQANQGIAVVLKKAAQATPVPVPAMPAQASSVVKPTGAAEASGVWKTIGWVLGGIGVVGLGVGTAFGLVAMGDKNGAHCDASNACDTGPLNSAKSAATVSDVGLIVGGVLVAGGTALILLAPGGGREGEASVSIGPTIGMGGGGVVIGGGW